MSSQAGLYTHPDNRSSADSALNASGSLRAALIITSIILVIEFVGGIYSNSLALLADALISGVVAILILSSSWILIRGAVDILLEGATSHINLMALRDQLTVTDGVLSVHDLHVWTLTSRVIAMSCHVVVGDDPNIKSDMLERIRAIARERFRIDHTTIQVESTNSTEFESCDCRFGAI